MLLGVRQEKNVKIKSVYAHLLMLNIAQIKDVKYLAALSAKLTHFLENEDILQNNALCSKSCK